MMIISNYQIIQKIHFKCIMILYTNFNMIWMIDRLYQQFQDGKLYIFIKGSLIKQIIYCDYIYIKIKYKIKMYEILSRYQKSINSIPEEDRNIKRKGLEDIKSLFN